MPRDVNGVMTPVAGNPVDPGTTVTSEWANATIADIVNEITNSLDRAGRGGMASQMLFNDGSEQAPAVSFAGETTLGFYRPAIGQIVVTVGGKDSIRFSAGGIIEVSEDEGVTWNTLSPPIQTSGAHRWAQHADGAMHYWYAADVLWDAATSWLTSPLTDYPVAFIEPPVVSVMGGANFRWFNQMSPTVAAENSLTQWQFTAKQSDSGAATPGSYPVNILAIGRWK